MNKTQEQRDHGEWVVSEQELTDQWVRLLSKTVVGDPEPESSGPSVDELALMDHETYGAQRAALGIPPDQSDFVNVDARPALRRFADSRHILPPEPDSQAKFAQEREALGIRSNGDIQGADPRPAFRRNPSPYRITGK